MMQLSSQDPVGDRLPGRTAVALSVLGAASIVALLHRWSGGAVLASRPLTVALFAAPLALVAVGWLGSFRRGDRGSSAAWDGCAAALAGLAGLLVLSTYWGGEVDIGGDYRMHRMYAYQLLNGFAESHEPYRGVPGHYPPLVHTLLAIGVQTTGLTVHYSMLLLSIVVSAGVAVSAFRVALGVGLSRLSARFFAALLVAWGGAWAFELREFQLYLPAVQLGLPFLSRNLALLLVLLVLELALRARARGAVLWLEAVALGAFVGLLGLTRPFEFGLAFGGLALAALLRRSAPLLGGLGVAAGLSALYWLPLALNWLELGIHATREVARAEDLPTSPFALLPLAPLMGLALCEWRAMPGPVRAGAVAVAGALAIPLTGALAQSSGVAAWFELEGGVLKLERIGQLLAIAVYGVAAFGLERAALRTHHGAIAAAAVALIALGTATTLRVNGTFLDGEVRVPSPRWGTAPRYWRDLAGSPFYLRHLLEDRRGVVVAPAPLGHLTASRNGVEVVWSHQAAPIWATTATGAASSEARRRTVDAFYAALGRGVVDATPLRAFDAKYFVATTSAAAALPEVTHLGPIGEFSGQTWHLLQVERVAGGPGAAGD